MASQDIQRLEVVAMELLMSLGQRDRYDLALRIAETAFGVEDYKSEALRKYRQCLLDKPDSELEPIAKETMSLYLRYLLKPSTQNGQIFLNKFTQALTHQDQIRNIESFAFYFGDESTDCMKGGNVWYRMLDATSTYLNESHIPHNDKLGIITFTKVILFYSALYPTDAGDAESLEEEQCKLRNYRSAEIKKVVSENRQFFKDHPIRWLSPTCPRDPSEF